MEQSIGAVSVSIAADAGDLFADKLKTILLEGLETVDQYCEWSETLVASRSRAAPLPHSEIRPRESTENLRHL